MKLICLYGPPAVGKLTIAKMLEVKTGYKLFHNHMIINPIVKLFGYENPSRRILVREFRIRILEEAAKTNTSLIITVGTAGPNIFDYFDDIIYAVESNGGKVCMVHLTADKATLLERVEHPIRKQHGKNFGKDKMEEIFLKYPHVFDSYSKKDNLTINTGNTLPEEAAEKIISFYQ